MELKRILRLGNSLDLFDDDKCRLSDELVGTGFVVPLPVRPAAEPDLLWGFAAARRASELGVDVLPTKEIHVEPADGLKLALQLENRTGNYSWRERERIVSYVEANIPGNRRSSSVRNETECEISRLVVGDGSLMESIARYRELSSELQSLLQEGLLKLKSARRAASVPESFLSLNRARLRELSFSTRRQFLEVLADLLMHGRPSGGVPGPGAGGQLPLQERNDLLSHAGKALNDLDPLAGLSELRYPTLSRMQDGFREVSARATGDSGIRVVPPLNFEGDELKVEFSFRSADELDQRLRSLGRLREHSEELLGFL